MGKGLKVLIIPLDWGLGHATRCIPIIRYLIAKGHQITLAGEGKTASLLKAEFPNITMLHVRGYSISYAKKGWQFIPSILFQVPKIAFTIFHENRWLKKNIQIYQWDIVISDNRYGLYTKHAKTIFITHQLGMISGLGKIADGMLQKILYHFIERFDRCFVPDSENETNIAGNLSHPKLQPNNVKYIGPISRMENTHHTEEDIILLLLSGPEPQRSILENILIEQASKLKHQFICVRGLPSDKNKLEDLSNIQFINHLQAKDLNTYILKSKLVVCRTGYSTVMDLLKLQKSAIMVPTPGQTEQEYLAKRLNKLGWFSIQVQQNIDLASGIQHFHDNNATLPHMNFEGYRKSLDDFSIQYFGA